MHIMLATFGHIIKQNRVKKVENQVLEKKEKTQKACATDFSSDHYGTFHFVNTLTNGFLSPVSMAWRVTQRKSMLKKNDIALNLLH